MPMRLHASGKRHPAITHHLDKVRNSPERTERNIVYKKTRMHHSKVDESETLASLREQPIPLLSICKVATMRSFSREVNHRPSQITPHHLRVALGDEEKRGKPNCFRMTLSLRAMRERHAISRRPAAPNDAGAFAIFCTE